MRQSEKAVITSQGAHSSTCPMIIPHCKQLKVPLSPLTRDRIRPPYLHPKIIKNEAQNGGNRDKR